MRRLAQEIVPPVGVGEHVADLAARVQIGRRAGRRDPVNRRQLAVHAQRVVPFPLPLVNATEGNERSGPKLCIR